MCVHRLAEDQVPSCVWSCPAQARVFGDLNAPESRLVQMLESRNPTVLLEEKGTHPKVSYLATASPAAAPGQAVEASS